VVPMEVLQRLRLAVLWGLQQLLCQSLRCVQCRRRLVRQWTSLGQLWKPQCPVQALVAHQLLHHLLLSAMHCRQQASAGEPCRQLRRTRSCSFMKRTCQQQPLP